MPPARATVSASRYHLRYLKAFVVSAPTMALLAHFLTEEPMPWWPDTVMFGGFMGAMAAVAVMRFTHARRAVGHLRRAGRAATGKRLS